MENNSAQHHPQSMFKVVVRQIVSVVVLTVVACGIYLFIRDRDEAPPAESAAPPQMAPEVDTMILQPQIISLEPEFLGQTEASQVVEIRSRVRGFLESRAFEEASVVKEGQLLFTIDPRSFEADLQVARSRLASTQAQLQRARQQVKRYSELVKQKAATMNELEEWQTQEEVYAAEVELQKAQIAQAELDVSYTKIHSPINGVIGESLKDVGTYVDDAANSLLAIVQQIDPIYVRYSVSENEMLYWRSMVDRGIVRLPELGELEIRITLADGSEYPHHGIVNYVDVEVDPSKGTSFIRATVPNPDMTLRPGQFVNVHVLGIQREQTILVPQESVMQTPTGSSVYVLNSQGLVEQRPVTLGSWYESSWIVESGLEPGDQLIINNLLQLRPGMEVTVAQEQNSNLTALAEQ
ncbi:MAG: efflux RND transporter periplasmic adaptor subunit [bacterium]